MLSLFDAHDNLQEELGLRRVQLTEIRAMLGLPPNAGHESVMAFLREIGKTDRRVNNGTRTSTVLYDPDSGAHLPRCTLPGCGRCRT
jgi:hypothetical protein